MNTRIYTPAELGVQVARIEQEIAGLKLELGKKRAALEAATLKESGYVQMDLQAYNGWCRDCREYHPVCEVCAERRPEVHKCCGHHVWLTFPGKEVYLYPVFSELTGAHVGWWEVAVSASGGMSCTCEPYWARPCEHKDAVKALLARERAEAIEAVRHAA